MTAAEGFYQTVVDRLIQGSSRAILGLKGFRSEPLREYLRTELEQAPGGRHSLLADLVFEATFGWELADCTMADLQGRLLHGQLVQALANPGQNDQAEDYTFPTSRSPYAHQLQAWQALLDSDRVQSVLVTSGTGSGKTECFLVPILNDLTQELTEKQDGGRNGVRAIFLYPLNALIKSQKERLQAWSEPFGGTIRFCLYNGDTPEDAKSRWRCEIPDRRTLRDQPPQILVTNPTMLEYMLVRAEDRPILNQSQGRLRWIVIDEAHTYLGSQAAELTLLLRRAMHAFGCTPGQVHVVATSATLGDASEQSRERLRQFLADLAGVSETQVTVISGTRIRPPAIEASRGDAVSAPNPEQWRDLDPQALYESVSREQPLERLRDALVEKPHTLEQMAQMLFQRSDDNAKTQTLRLIDICARAHDRQGRPFLPLRAHIFHRTLPGLWACANQDCSARLGTALNNARWPFGAVYLERRESCHCGAPVFDLVQCGGCGAEYLAAEEVSETGRDYLRARTEQAEEDEFQEHLEPPEGALVDEAAEPKDWAGVGRERLLTSSDGATQQRVGLEADGTLDWKGELGFPINLCMPDHNGLTCPVCGEAKQDGQLVEQFRPVRVGAPFLLTSTTPTLLSLLPPWRDTNTARPLDGRRLVTFTDSRQGAARTVVKAQQQVERDYVGSLIYHHLAGLATPVDPATLADKEQQVQALREVAKRTPAIKPTLDRLEAELQDLRTPPLGELGWDELVSKLHSAEDFTRWLKPALSDLTYGQLSDQNLAELCLFREFFLRPRRQYSLEGLGLVQLRYPELEKTAAPASFKQKGLGQCEWVHLLRTAVDVFIRSGSPAVEIPHTVQRWLGYPGRPAVLLSPGRGKKTQPSQRYWPSTRQPSARRNRLVRLLSLAFDLDLDRAADAHFADEVLQTMWHALVGSRVLAAVEGGFQLSLKQSARFQGVSQAWLCPVTRRLLPVTFKGITPYLPVPPVATELVYCQRVEVPRLPYPFWQGVAEHDADRWLVSAEIHELRILGTWTDISDRIARFSRYYSAAEHSAQLSGSELTRRERDFKNGKINLLSCSTTMEMGVDIGGLTAVAMNNVPPHPANFLQRAGRAGRRGETQALSFTLCKATPHGEAVFRDPLWPFHTTLATPKVDLRSASIVQRHLNALALATFLVDVAPESAHRLKIGWFFEPPDADHSAPAARFIDWCQTTAAEAEKLKSGVEWLTRSSQLEGVSVKELLARTAVAMQEVDAGWRLELDGLFAQQVALKTRDGQSKPEVAIAVRLERWRREYLLGQLASRAFLPGYGFPTGIVPFVTITAEELSHIKRDTRAGREDNRQRRAGFPTRDLALAIRDYAPGTDTVLSGRVYRSAGVTLNWQLPVEAQGAAEIQDLRWVWRCGQCGGNGTRLSKPEMCPTCGCADENKLTVRRFLQPAGFAVDFRSRPHNDITVPQYMPVKDPLIAMGGAEWMMLPRVALGRYRTTPTGQLFHYSDGVHGKGYSLCLRCGRADSMSAQGKRPQALQDHKRLQGGKRNDSERICPGNEESWAILDAVRLGATYTAEVFELQLRDADGRPLRDRATSYTFAIALRRAFCSLIGIEEGEIGAAAAESRSQEGSSTYAIYLYDTASGGAGYASQVSSYLPELIRQLKEATLRCPNACDSACQGCLLTYETQHHVDELNRHAVTELLSERFVDAFALPSDLRAFGESTYLELEPLTLAVDREWQRWKFDTIRVFLAGKSSDWEPLDWRFLNTLRRFRARGIDLILVIDEPSLSGLEQSQRDELFVLAVELGASLQAAKDLRTILAQDVMIPALEVTSPSESMRWATTHPEAAAPNFQWGSGDSGARFVRSARRDTPLDSVAGAAVLEPDSLRGPVAAGVVEIKIRQDLDGPVWDFGTRAWTLAAGAAQGLAKALRGNAPLVRLRYTDRYLRSPLAVLLLERLLAGLEEFPGGLCSECEVLLTTTGLGNRHPTAPKLWTHDWQDHEDREKVVRLLLTQRFQRCQWWVRDIHDVSHARHFALEWGDGTIWQIRLDQGVGYWRPRRHYGKEFPFMLHPERQVMAFTEPRLEVEGASSAYQTYWYCVQEQ